MTHHCASRNAEYLSRAASQLSRGAVSKGSCSFGAPSDTPIKYSRPDFTDAIQSSQYAVRTKRLMTEHLYAFLYDL